MRALTISLLVTAVLGLGIHATHAAEPSSYAIFAEYARDSNKLMKPGLNRRMFNVTEAQGGTEITLNADGSITLEPGTYRLSGFSLVTMQTAFAPPVMKNNTNYPGYCLVYLVGTAADQESVMKDAIAIGTPQTAFDGVPSIFDAIYTAKTRTQIALAHQSGMVLNDEVYLSVFEAAGISSDTHVFARIAIARM